MMKKTILFGAMLAFGMSVCADIDTSVMTNGASFGERRQWMIDTALQVNTNTAAISVLENTVSNLSGVDADTLDGYEATAFVKTTDEIDADLLQGYAATNFMLYDSIIDVADIAGLGTAATLDAGTNANDLVQYTNLVRWAIATNTLAYVGGVTDVTNFTSGAATDGYVATADGSGGILWEAASGGGSVTNIDVGTTSGTDALALGAESYATNDYAVAIGPLAEVEGVKGIGLGWFSWVEGDYGVAAGPNAHAGGERSFAAGYYGDTSHNDTFMWSSATMKTTTTNDQFYVWADNGSVFGGGAVTVENATADPHAVNRVTGDGRWLQKSAGYTGTNTVLNGEGTTNTVIVINGQITSWN